MNPCEGCQEDVDRSCRNCHSAFCAGCREAITGSKEKCPACNGYVGDDQNCRVGGGGCGK